MNVASDNSASVEEIFVFQNVTFTDVEYQEGVSLQAFVDPDDLTEGLVRVRIGLYREERWDEDSIFVLEPRVPLEALIKGHLIDLHSFWMRTEVGTHSTELGSLMGRVLEFLCSRHATVQVSWEEGMPLKLAMRIGSQEVTGRATSRIARRFFTRKP